MTHRAVFSALTAFAALVSGAVFSQPPVDRFSVPLIDPDRPVVLKVGLLSGAITVKAHAGKEVIVEATSAVDDEDQGKEQKGGTLKRIPNTSTGLTAEEENNEVTVSTGLHGSSRRTDLLIQVPARCSMKLSTVNEGDIEVENVNGDLEINNTNGSITLKQISGSAVAQTVNGEVRVTFARADPDKAMSFSTFNGDIDVTLPAATKATVQLKSEQGEIFSDFDIRMEKSAARVDRNDKGKGKFRVTIERAMRGTINGGGQDIRFNNFNGDIYIRKGG